MYIRCLSPSTNKILDQYFMSAGGNKKWIIIPSVVIMHVTILLQNDDEVQKNKLIIH